MVISRANADHDNMGLRSWKGDNVTQADVDVSKNYLAEGERKEFNRLTVILLDIFEQELDLGKLNTMSEVGTFAGQSAQITKSPGLAGRRLREDCSGEGACSRAISGFQREAKGRSLCRGRRRVDSTKSSGKDPAEKS